ncbi:myocilin-like [Brienomyrus brachyistius]|uniref:myocilin-like n=1 Tax=Brienomyrus brachyistius TaxID=42636 RepID=UPI0020B2C779|nr:myocilin-like [Brienomyrus brachyistius]
MWIPLVACLCCLLASSRGQERASFRRGNDQRGRCQYSFTVESPTEASCPAAGGPELEGVKSRLALLETLVGRLTGAGESGGEIAPLRREKERLERQVQELQGQLGGLRQELESLRARPCQTASSARASAQDRSQRPLSGSSIFSHLMSRPGNPSETDGVSDSMMQQGRVAYQELKAEVTEVPASRLNQKPNQESTGCGELMSIREPETHRKADTINGKYGVWFRDPEPGRHYGPEMVWRIDTVGADVRQLFAYENMDQLVRGFPTKVLLLPEPVESTGATMFRGSLYYQRRRSRTLLRYDLASERVAARRELPHAGFHGQYPYSWGGYTDVDLAVDEKGLWAIYSTNKAKGAIVVSQLDPNTLEVRKTWETTIRKNTVANSFMACGRLYTLASYSSPNTTINYTFDTATGQLKAISVPFRNLYRYNSMVDYNHASKKLYAWDNFHMVSYDVQLAKPDI